jgi:hypothetical protein
MITFYARDVGMWRKDFTFSDEIESRSKTFQDRTELIEFMKTRGIRLDDPEYPLKFIGPEEHHFGYVYTIIQWSLIGWMKE